MRVLVLLPLLLAAVHALPLSNDAEFAMVAHETGLRLVNLDETPQAEPFYNPETDITFLLFTRDHPTDAQILRWDDSESIRNSRFNPNHPTRVTIHGWGGSAGGGTNRPIHRAYFEVGEFNCITVDWSIGAGSNNYITARNRVGPTGEIVGRLLRNIIDTTGARPADMTVIGFSLGGHVAGFTGKNTPNLAAVVALDAAGPWFHMDQPSERTAITDAEYVESIHTNAGLLGFDEPLGHANFYPNWGRRQPGCGADISGNCAHGRAITFFAESITTQVGFWGRQCSGYDDIVAERCERSGNDVRMGGQPLSTNSRGVFWFTTNSEAPFARGMVW